MPPPAFSTLPVRAMSNEQARALLQPLCWCMIDWPEMVMPDGPSANMRAALTTSSAGTPDSFSTYSGVNFSA